MQSNRKRAVVLAAVVAGVLAVSQADAADPSPSDLRAQAKVTEAQATATALAKLPQGKVKSAELEKENGKLVWSFDIAQPRVRGVTEIQIDAITGATVSRKKETPAEEAREAKAEAKEAATAK
jgi:uncharacterized membrane protein YkoI